MLLGASHTRDFALKGSQEQLTADSAAAQQLGILIPGKTAPHRQKSLERGFLTTDCSVLRSNIP